MMRITHHGGGCCAIKQICGLGYTPDDNMYERSAPKYLASAKHYANTDANGGSVDSARCIYWFSRPHETAGARFNAFLEFLKKHRPCSLVEVTIVPYEESARYPDDPDCWSDYQKAWVPFLEARGFNCVAKVANSNSGNHVWVYHLVLEDEEWDYHGYHNSYFVMEEEDEDIYI